jgi:hypothetical protein
MVGDVGTPLDNNQAGYSVRGIPQGRPKHAITSVVMEQACELGDRLCYDAAEFEGRLHPAAAGGAEIAPPWHPTQAELALAWALLPLLLVGVFRMWRRGSHGRMRSGSGLDLAGLRSRCMLLLPASCHAVSKVTGCCVWLLIDCQMPNACPCKDA